LDGLAARAFAWTGVPGSDGKDGVFVITVLGGDAKVAILNGAYFWWRQRGNVWCIPIIPKFSDREGASAALEASDIAETRTNERRRLLVQLISPSLQSNTHKSPLDSCILHGKFLKTRYTNSIIIRRNIMEKTTIYSKNVALGIIGLLVVFMGLCGVAVILDALTWETMKDWTTKAVLIGVVVFVVNVIGALIVNTLAQKDQK
jgi:hypothetical protein